MRQKRTALGLALFASFFISSFAIAAERIAQKLAQTQPTETAVPEGSVQAPPSSSSISPNRGTGTQAGQATQGRVPSAQQPAAVQQAPVAPRQIERVEPVATPVAASSKSQAQLEYEANMQIRFDGYAKRIKELELQLETLSKKDQRIQVKSLQTAQGNRSVARTKLKQLRFIAPAQWTSVQADIERAMNDLEVSLQRVDALMNPKQ